MNALLENVKELALESGLTLPELAKLSGCSETWVKAVLTGFTQSPGILKLTALHDALAAEPLGKYLPKPSLKIELRG
ncbi:MAG: helix-turn-helix domain-containing protein [Synergistaceae bacterium]